MRSCEKFILLSFPVTGLKCSNFPVRLTRSRLETRDLGNPASSPSHMNLSKGFRGKARSRKSGQLGRSGSCEEALSNRAFYLLTDNLILRSYELGEGRLLVCNVYYSRSILINYRKGKYASYQLLYRCFLDHVIIPSNICRCLNRGSHLTA